SSSTWARATGCSASSTRSSTRGSASTTPRSSSRPRHLRCYASRDPIRYSESPEEAAEMRRESRLSVWLAAVAMATGLIGYGGREVAEAADAKPGAWMGGAGFGFLADTPNGTAFALNLNAETFVAPKFSVGPLLQLGFTSVSSQVGLSGQAKFWVDVPNIAQGFRVTA